MEIREFILSYIRDGNEIIDSKFDIENDKNESIDFEEEVFSQNEEGVSETNLSKRSLKVFEKVYMDLHVDEMEFSNEDFKNIYFNIIECFNENKE